MNPETITKIDPATLDRARAIDLIELAKTYVKLSKESGSSVSGPCPKCFGNDRFWIRDNKFHCRVCHPKPGDPIEFLQWVGDARSFRESVEKLTGEAYSLPPARQLEPVKPKQSQEWRDDARSSVDRCHNYLMTSEKAEPGRTYLESRGLDSRTWEPFKLGYTNAPLPGTHGRERRPAIILPWLKGGQVVGVRYRFLEHHTYIDVTEAERTENKSSMAGSHFGGVLFGGLGLRRAGEKDRTLVICEGEFNAMSIWQVANHTGLDVLSIGSESQTLTSSMIDYAKQFRLVIVWTDRAEVAKSLQLSLPGSFGACSPNGHDANDLLIAGHLGGYLSKWRFDAIAHNAEGQKHLFDDLSAGNDSWFGLDQGSSQVMAAIAKRLGLKVGIDHEN